MGGFGGLAGGFGEAIGLTSELAIGAANAAASNLAVGLIDAGVSGNFDIGELLEGAAFSYITSYAAGAINLTDIGVTLGDNASLGLIREGGQLTLASFSEGVLDGAITSGLSSAVYDTDFSAGFISAAVASTVSLASADFQSGIGDIGIGDPNWEGSIEHMVLHGARRHMADHRYAAVQLHQTGRSCAAQHFLG